MQNFQRIILMQTQIHRRLIRRSETSQRGLICNSLGHENDLWRLLKDVSEISQVFRDVSDLHLRL